MKTLNRVEEALKTFDSGLRSRKVHSTLMNDASSRSHLVFGVIVTTRNNNTGEVTRGKISFVDLAGSERLSKSNPGGRDPERLKESTAINQSLKTLGDVIQDLSSGNSNRAHIRYRESKLTRLMKDSLGGNAKTLMFVNISPAVDNSHESLYSLQFGTRAKMVQNEATKNVESEYVQSLKIENSRLKKELGIH
jgi:kinesin family protein C2/C3